MDTEVSERDSVIRENKLMRPCKVPSNVSAFVSILLFKGLNSSKSPYPSLMANSSELGQGHHIATSGHIHIGCRSFAGEMPSKWN